MHIKNKIVLVTGGASGLGFSCTREFLRNGAAHVSILDLAISNGEGVVARLEVEYGKGRVSFFVCDVTKSEELKAAFKKTFQKFSRLDIVVNNAGIFDDFKWEMMININLNAVIHGTMLALEYMGKDNGGKGGIIVNIASIAGIAPFAACPLYCATKHAVVGLSRSFGTPYHYEKSGVRVLVLCPGITETTMSEKFSTGDSEPAQKELVAATLEDLPSQKSESVAQGLIFVIRSAQNGSVWIAEGGEPIYEISIPDRLSMKTFTKEQ